MAAPTEMMVVLLSLLLKLTSGKHFILIIFLYVLFLSFCNQAQLLDSLTEARDTLYSDDTTQTGNSKDVDWMTSQMDIDKQVDRTKKRGKVET